MAIPAATINNDSTITIPILIAGHCGRGMA